MDSEEAATADLIAAKDAYRKHQTDETRAAKDAAVERLVAIRNELRADREGVGVVADTVTVQGD